MVGDVFDNLLTRPCGCVDKRLNTTRDPRAVRCTVPWAGGVYKDSELASVVETEYRLHEVR